MENYQIAEYLIKIASVLEIRKDNPYKIRAYRKAAASIQNYPLKISSLIDEKVDLTNIQYIGKGIAKQIEFIVKNETIPEIFQKKAVLYRSELKLIKGISTKRIKILNERSIFTIKDLKHSIKNNTLMSVPGFNLALLKKIQANIANYEPYEKYFNIVVATKIAEAIKSKLSKLREVKEVRTVGDLRRQVEAIGNIDFLVVSPYPKKVIEQFIQFEEIYQFIRIQNNFCAVLLYSKMQVSINIAPRYNPVLELFITGSKSHLNSLKSIAKTKGMSLTRKGLTTGNRITHCKDENNLYQKLGLSYIDPELRECHGEITASANKCLPKLITYQDIKGDLHCHTKASDGIATIEEMAKEAQKLGYDYIAISDHSKRLTIAHGLSEERLLQQLAEIDTLNQKFTNFTILKASEVDILEDGSLDFSDEILKKLDIRVCSIHSKFNLSKKEQTERIIRSMDNPYFNILGHPTGRLIPNIRQPYQIDIERILEAARVRNCFVEINCQPARLDLKDTYCFMAKSLGVKMAISSDAHSIRGLEFVKYGVSQARRGWLEADDIINTRNLQQLKALLKRN